MQRAAYISCLVAIVLAAGTFVLVRSRSPQSSASSSSCFRLVNPGAISSITIEFPESGEMTIRPEAGSDSWTLSDSEDRHIIRTEHVRGLLGLLSQLDDLPTQPLSGDHGDFVRVTIRERDAQARSMRLYPIPLGGRVPVWCEGPGSGRWVLADASLAKVLTPSGVRAWRDAALLWTVGGEPPEVSLDAGGRRTRLARSRGRWSMLDPVAAPADAEACRSLLSQLAALKADRFESRPDAASVAPTAVVELRTPIRFAEGDSVGERTLVQSIRFVEVGPGRIVGMSEAAWEDAGILSPAWGRRVLEAAPGEIAFLFAKPGAYLSRVASRIPLPDVQGVRVREAGAEHRYRSFERAVGGWKRENGSVAADPAEARHLDTLLRLLCETQASAATLEPPAARQPFARIGLVVGGVEAEVMTLSRASIAIESTPTPVLVVETGSIARLYPEGEWAKLLDWITVCAAPEG